MTPERQDELVAAAVERLERDLAYAAPEMWMEHVKRAMEDLADDLTADDQETTDA